MILAKYDGEQWGTENVRGAGQVSCGGEIFSLIGKLITCYGLVVDKEHPLAFNLEHYAWTRSAKNGEVTEG